MTYYNGFRCRVFGSEKTALELTPKAQAIYNDTDPLKIYEREIIAEDVPAYLYAISGAFDAGWIDAAEVNAFLEAFADEIDKEEENRK